MVWATSGGGAGGARAEGRGAEGWRGAARAGAKADGRHGRSRGAAWAVEGWGMKREEEKKEEG